MSITHEERRTEDDKLYDELVLERVKAGIALLEKEHGPDWVEHIDMKKLDLMDGAACVLGQVYKDNALSHKSSNGYWVGAQILGITNEEYKYGFSIDEDLILSDEMDDDEEPSSGPHWAALQACWTDVLTPIVSRN